MFQFLLHAAQQRPGRHRPPDAQFGRDVPPLGHCVGVLEQVLVGEIGDRDEFLAGEPASRGHDDHPGLAAQRLGFQAAQVSRQPHVPDVGPAVPEDLGLIEPVGAQHLDRQVRMPRPPATAFSGCRSRKAASRGCARPGWRVSTTWA